MSSRDGEVATDCPKDFLVKTKTRFAAGCSNQRDAAVAALVSDKGSTCCASDEAVDKRGCGGDDI